MKAPAEFFHYLEHALKSIAGEAIGDGERVDKVYALVTQFFVTAGEDEPLHFTTLFARIAHTCTRFQVPARWVHLIQHFRIAAEDHARKGELTSYDMHGTWIEGGYALHAISAQILNVTITTPSQELLGAPLPRRSGRKPGNVTFKRIARLVAYQCDTQENILWVSDADTAEGDIKLSFGDPGRSELYKENILHAIDVIGLPFALSAIDIEISPDGMYSPRVLVIEPDYLIDISTIAECYQDSGGDIRLYLPKKFQETRSSPALLTGRIANFFLDELIHTPDTPFKELFARTFFLSPTEFATLSNEEVLQMMKDCETHYTNLRNTVLNEFPKLGLDRSKMYIEPAFFSPAFGIQGRLDLFQSDAQSKQIIELKSGQPFKANAYGLSSTHYAQTLLYDLMIKAVYDFKPRQTCYILYSRTSQQTLRYAPPVEAIQREVIRLRNDILLVERAISKQSAKEPGWFERITPERIPEASGFLARDIALFSKTWQGLDEIEKQYVRIFSRFTAREHYFAKVGMHGSDQVNGLASLWLDTDREKADRFAIYRNLVIDRLEERPTYASSSDAYVTLVHDIPADTLVNFRTGDIAVLYPMCEDAPGVLKNQIYKCTVTALDPGQITVRLRSHQVNYEDIQAHDQWTLEHDLYDRSFNVMHSALFSMARVLPERRSLFLGRTHPGRPRSGDGTKAIPLQGHQKLMLEKMINAQDYFLLWGPPGTGKTSVILHHLVSYHLQHTNDRILLLAYTNRAVDEICEALDAIGNNIRDAYVRIGSHISTGDTFTGQLLHHKISDMTKRKEVVAYLQSQRIIVGTISSIAGKPELFKLISTDIVVVDEASQILEPMLAGILPDFRKWILIGDHRQLPAVVAQSREETLLDSDSIAEMALEDTRDSYFERMYHLCRRNGWDWAYGSLTEQGRMHQQLMELPSRLFYDSQLELLPPAYWNGRDFTGPLKTPVPPGASEISRALSTQRLLWFPSMSSGLQEFSKTHDEEAEIVTHVLQELIALYGTLPNVGVITPFRAQIANIRSMLRKADINPDDLTIDTVERYQGSARDIIILSLSIHHPMQLQHLVSPSREGVDRKLNVALTRAREQFILIAEESVIRHNAIYQAVADACAVVNLQPEAASLRS